MGQVLHGSATTTEAIRRAIQHSQASLRALALRYGINPKTVAKWKKRGSVTDLPTGPREPKSTVLSIEEEAILIAFRRHTLLPLDDCLYALQPAIPHLTRSSLHRCLQRHGISRLPQVEGDTPDKRKFKPYPIGYFHIDIAEVRTEEGKLYLFVAVDRTSKFAFVALHEKADRQTAVRFLEALIAAVPYRLHTVLTDNGIQFADLPKNRDGWTARYRVHRFDQICRANGIEHRLTKPNHPWTNGQVERMNRTLKEATVNRYYYETHDQLRAHLADFLAAYNFGRRLKTLRGLTPYEHICQAWTEQPDRFILDPIHQMPGLNTYPSTRLFDTISNVLVLSPLASWMRCSWAFINVWRAGSKRRHWPSAWTIRAATCGLSGSSVSTSSARNA
jgi:transposase InsO family protein